MIKTLEKLKEQLGSYRQVFRMIDFQKGIPDSEYADKLRTVAANVTIHSRGRIASKRVRRQCAHVTALALLSEPSFRTVERRAPSSVERVALDDLVHTVSSLACLGAMGELAKAEDHLLYDLGYSLGKEYTDAIGWDFCDLRDGSRVADALRALHIDSEWRALIWLVFWVGKVGEVCGLYDTTHGSQLRDWAKLMQEVCLYAGS